MKTSAPKLARVTTETVGQQVKRRRIALQLSVRQLAAKANVDRARIAAIEADSDKVREITTSRVLATLERLEKGYGADDPDRIVSHLKLPDGTEAWFEGSADGVAEAVAKFLAQRD